MFPAAITFWEHVFQEALHKPRECLVLQEANWSRGSLAYMRRLVGINEEAPLHI